MKSRIDLTLIFSLAVAVGGATFTSTVTTGFENWTFESMRIEAVKNRLIKADRSQLIDSNGNQVSYFSTGDSNIVYVVDFIYTRCPTICLTLGSEFQQMQKKLIEGNSGKTNVKLLSISFDVENDKPSELKGQENKYEVNEKWWKFLVPIHLKEKEQLLQSLGIVVIPDGMGGFQHNGALHVISGDGLLLGIYDYERWELALRHAQSDR